MAGRRTEAGESKKEAARSKTGTTGSKTEAAISKTGTTGSKTEATASKTKANGNVSKTSKRKIGVRLAVQTIEITPVKTLTAMVITRMGDGCRNIIFVAPALLKRCDRFLLRRIRFCHSRAVSARNHFHRVSYGRHTLKQNMEASNGNATLSCASPRFTHTSFVDKSGDWELAISMSS